MDYITAIVALFQCTNFTLSERSKIVNFNFDFGVTLLPKYMQLVELVESFPNRDCVVLTLKNENDDLFVISSSDLSSQQKFDSFKADCEYSEQLSGVILINKSVQGGCISVYNFSNFIHELCLLSLDEILRTFQPAGHPVCQCRRLKNKDNSSNVSDTVYWNKKEEGYYLLRSDRNNGFSEKPV